MPYVEGRVVHDADAHIMETPNWLRDHADPGVRDRIEPLQYTSGNELRQTGDPDEQLRDIDAAFERLAAKHASAEYRADEEAEIMQRKNFAATGSFIAEDRPRALDLMGVKSQLLFNTFHNRRLRDWEHTGDVELAYGAARAHNRGMAEFCSVDARLLPTLYVPLLDFDRAAAMADEALGMGAAALLIASGCPRDHSPSHIGLDPVWARAQEARIPVVFHVGGTGDLLEPGYFRNGLPIPPDFHGGEENFRSVDYMGIPHPPMQTLATMIFDGVLERFPDLRIGVIEQGAIWMPSWMRQMESAFEAFARHEERLKALSLRPSEYVRRQVRATPYPTEDVGWIIEQSGDEVCLFSSDFPHVEGGRKPVERFEASLGDASEEIRDRFYRTNFEDLMGAALRDLVRGVTADLADRAHANLADFQERSGRLTPGTRVETREGLLLVSPPFPYPGYRTALRVGAVSAASIDAARDFFAADDGVFTMYARLDDTELLELATAAGLSELFQPPEMVCESRPEARPAPDGVEVRFARGADDVSGYARVAGDAFAQLTLPADQTRSLLDNAAMLDDPAIVIAVAEADGEIVGGAMSVTSPTGCYIGWVAADAGTRRRGIGDAVTRAVTIAGFEAGATMASLEASPFGYKIYDRMGFDELYKYALLLAT